MSQHCTGKYSDDRDMLFGIGFLCFVFIYFFLCQLQYHKEPPLSSEISKEKLISIFFFFFNPFIWTKDYIFFVNREKFRTLRSTKPFKILLYDMIFFLKGWFSTEKRFEWRILSLYPSWFCLQAAFWHYC